MPAVTRPSSRRSGLLQLVVVVIFCGLGGYQQLFSTFAPYDDEGYLMLSLDGFQQRGQLYDQVYSQYGPAYYLLQSALLRCCQLPIAHDAARMRTLLFWLAASLLAAGALWRMTGNRWLSLLAVPILFQHLDRFVLEPGHPQEWCTLLLAGSWLAGTYVTTTTGRVQQALVALLASCCGTVSMIKPNLGALLTLAVLTALILHLPRSHFFSAVLRTTCAVLVCIVPWIVARARLDDPAALQLVVTISASTLLVLLRAMAALPNESAVRWRHVFLFCLLGCTTILFFAAGAVLAGTTLRGLITGLVSQHVAFGARAFYRPPPVPGGSSCWLLGMLVIYWIDMRLPHIARWLRPLAGVLIVATVIAQMMQASQVLVHGVTDRSLASYWIFWFGPLAWMAIPRDKCRWPVVLLALAAILQPLGAYPVPGTQMAVGSWLLLALGWYTVHLAIQDRELWNHWRLQLTQQRLQKLAMCFAVLILASMFVRGGVFAWRRAHYTALALPGTQGMRLPREQAEELQWAVKQLGDSADTFVFRAHTRGSMYYWTRLAPPTWYNATCWPYLLTAQQQASIVQVLSQRGRVGVVDEPYPAPLPVNDSPLLRYIDGHFVPLARKGDWGWRIGTLELE